MRQLITLVAAGVALLSAAGAAAADPVQETVDKQVEAALEGGLEPADFHHLFFAFNWRETLTRYVWVHEALTRLSDAAAIDPLMQAELALTRAQIALEEGHADDARQEFHRAGGLDRWWVAGPESLTELEDFGRIATDPSSRSDWRSTPGADPLGWVSVSGLAWPARRQLVYLATTVESEREQPIALHLGVAQVARVWVNSQEVLTTEYPLAHAEDQIAAGAWLGRGKNLVVVAVASESDDWWVRVRLTSPDGDPIDGVDELDEPPLQRTPAMRQVPAVRSLAGELEEAANGGDPQALLAYAAFLVARHPEPTTSSKAPSACRAARAASPSMARLLEYLVTSEPGARYRLLEQALDAQPDLLWARLPLARWCHRRGLLSRAAELLREEPVSPLAEATLLDLEAESWGAVVLHRLHDLADKTPGCVEISLAVLNVAVDDGHWPVAQQAMERLETIVPGLPQVLSMREEIARQCGDSAALETQYGELVARDPNAVMSRLRLARLLLGEQRLEEARQLITEGLRRCPQHAELLGELARIAHTQGDETEAVRLARQLLEARPQDRQARRLLELLGDESEDLSWLRSPEQLWQLADAASPAAPGLCVLEHREVHFLPGNLIEERVQLAYLVTVAEQAEPLLRHTLPWVPERQSMRVLNARILRRDGSEVAARQADTPRLSEPELSTYYDTRLRILAFNQLEDQDLVEISYVLTETAEANETGPYQGGIVMLGHDLGVHRAEIELEGKPELLPHWELANIVGEPVRRVDTDGVVTLLFAWDDIPPLSQERPPAPVLLTTPHLVYSSHPEWGELADWYQRHVAPRVRPSRQIEELAHKLLERVKGRRRQIAVLYRFVADEVRYVGLELGEHRMRPFSADWVVNNKIGDCKDKAALLVSLLRVIGVEARMVLLRTGDLGPTKASLAVLESFNHAITYLPEDDLWLDGTAAGHDPLTRMPWHW